MNTVLGERVLAALRGAPAQNSRELVSKLGISRATLTRAIKALGSIIFTTGAARSTKYSLRRPIRNLGDTFPVYRINEKGECIHLGELVSLFQHDFYVSPRSDLIRSAYYRDIPYWMNDLRPSGFLGRMIGKRHPELGFPADIRLWSSDDCLQYLSTLAWDPIGEILVGERAYELYLKYCEDPPNLVAEEHRSIQYPQLAHEIMSFGTAGSSAAGEQPKFLAVKFRKSGTRIAQTPVLVKFSPEGSDASSRRYQQLLVSEDLALKVLHDAGIPTAKSELVYYGDSVFLELERFDRVGLKGRRGVISLHSIDLEFLGNLGNWVEISEGLRRKELISQKIFEEIMLRYYFGLCIGNTDMHAGNLSFFTEGEKITGLAPVYDMFPAAFMPIQGQLPALRLDRPVLLPNHREYWEEGKRLAQKFWREVEERLGLQVEHNF